LRACSSNICAPGSKPSMPKHPIDTSNLERVFWGRDEANRGAAREGVPVN
jgi:hypothetical protein